MRHYFGNTGLPLTIDLENMVKTVPSARIALINQFRDAQRFVQGLPFGQYDFVAVSGVGETNDKGENSDWYFAVGSYAHWAKGRVKIEDVNGQRRYDVGFNYKIYDRYNWDGGKEVNFGPIIITDEFMGDFHREGLAMEFDCHGS